MKDDTEDKRPASHFGDKNTKLSLKLMASDMGAVFYA
jgi:hypothetical protein